jgi:hypothetical protein
LEAEENQYTPGEEESCAEAAGQGSQLWGGGGDQERLAEDGGGGVAGGEGIKAGIIKSKIKTTSKF